MPSFKRPIGASGLALAMALVAAACGSGTADTTATAGAGTESAQPAQDPSAAAPTQAESTDPEAEGPTPESEGPAPAVPHAFPDLNTVTIADGSAVNLADELAGGDTPVLLWFFAPH